MSTPPRRSNDALAKEIERLANRGERGYYIPEEALLREAAAALREPQPITVADVIRTELRRFMPPCYMCMEMTDSHWDESDPCGPDYKHCACADSWTRKAAEAIEAALQAMKL